MKKITTALFAFLVFPMVAFAQNLQGVLGSIQGLLNMLIPILVTLAVIYFFWGLGTYILAADSQDKRQEGRNMMIYGIIALFVMVSIWGIIGLIGESFNIDQGGSGGEFIPTI